MEFHIFNGWKNSTVFGENDLIVLKIFNVYIIGLDIWKDEHNKPIVDIIFMNFMFEFDF